MKNYQVKILEVYRTIVDVMADNPDSAREVAADFLSAGMDYNLNPIDVGTYDHTLPPEEWKVWETD
jgi:hypothetical protein